MYTPTPATATPPSRLPPARHVACCRACTRCVPTRQCTHTKTTHTASQSNDSAPHAKHVPVRLARINRPAAPLSTPPPRPLQSGAPATQSSPPEPGAARTPPDGVQRVAARNPPPSPSPPHQSPSYCWTGSSLGGSKTRTDNRNTKEKAQTNGCMEILSDCDRKRLHVSTCRLGWCRRTNTAALAGLC